MPDGSRWPRISLVTPSLNQGQYLEETIRSVLLQGYPDLEYIIIDGGSTDASLNIIDKYKKWIKHWVSEPDNGQSHAINKGLSRGSGDIFAYINSDDYYEPGAFKMIAPFFAAEKGISLVCGECVILSDKSNQVFKPWWFENLIQLSYGSSLPQPATFWTKRIYELVNGFNENLHYCFDAEFFLKIGIREIKPTIVEKKLANFRYHKTNKSITQRFGFCRDAIFMLNEYGSLLGLSQKEQQKKIRELDVLLRYYNVFDIWKKKGRRMALIEFLKMIMNYPALICDRNILKQARLVFF
jgi:glycosyltransferase involved in cell wall biosynthesis